MKRIMGRFGLMLTIMAAVGLLAQSSAYGAGAVAFAVEGSGSISPGLTLTSTPQSVTFSGTIIGLTVATGVLPSVGTAAGIGSCTFSGSSTGGETQATGQGTVSGSCSGASVGATLITCTVSYSRVGPVVVITASCTIVASGPLGSGSATGTGVGAFVFVPTSAPGAPVTSYDLVGVAAGAGA
jgi:hypothetical protein